MVIAYLHDKDKHIGFSVLHLKISKESRRLYLFPTFYLRGNSD